MNILFHIKLCIGTLDWFKNLRIRTLLSKRYAAIMSDFLCVTRTIMYNSSEALRDVTSKIYA